MKANQELLEQLFRAGQIDLRRGPIFDAPPGPMPEGLDFDRVEGMMLGLAVGDALGNTSEGLLPQQRRDYYGEIRHYLPNRYANGAAVGLPSDDTQLAFWTLEQMLADGGFNPKHVARRFCRDRIFGIGSTVRGFIHNYESGMPWYRCGPKSAGNGALMRIAPMLIPHLKSGSADLWIDTALSAMITHNDSASIASCISFTNMLWQLLKTDAPPQPEWWLETFVQAARELEIDESYRPSGGLFADYQGPLWRFVLEKVGQAYRSGLTVEEACNQWYSGAFLLETVPSIIFILMRHGEDPEEAIVWAVNDTAAAIVGAAVGAWHGKGRIPERWRLNLAGRTGESDDGKVFDLLRDARKVWWDG